MPEKKKSSGKKTEIDTSLSTRTKKQIDSLPTHAQHIFKKAHGNAVKEYQNPSKRRGGKSQKDIEEDKESGSLKCDVCGQTFDTMESFREHKLSENKDEELKYKGVD
jgi:cation transport regulator ChaB